MEYKYYTKTAEGYELKKQMGIIYFAVTVFAVLGILGLWYGLTKGERGSFVWAAFCALFIAIPIYGIKSQKILFNPQSGMILVKKGRKEKKYAFSEFLNFQKTIIRNNGITTQWHVSVYVN